MITLLVFFQRTTFMIRVGNRFKPLLSADVSAKGVRKGVEEEEVFELNMQIRIIPCVVVGLVRSDCVCASLPRDGYRLSTVCEEEKEGGWGARAGKWNLATKFDYWHKNGMISWFDASCVMQKKQRIGWDEMDGSIQRHKEFANFLYTKKLHVHFRGQMV